MYEDEYYYEARKKENAKLDAELAGTFATVIGGLIGAVLSCLIYVEKIAENLEGLVCAIGCDSMPSDGAIYVDGEQKVNYISTREALRILDGFGNNSASVMIGKSDYILIYDASRKLVIDGEAYLPSGYLVMKSCNGLQAIDDEDFADVIAALKSRMTMLALGKYRIQAYQLG